MIFVEKPSSYFLARSEFSVDFSAMFVVAHPGLTRLIVNEAVMHHWS